MKVTLTIKKIQTLVNLAYCRRRGPVEPERFCWYGQLGDWGAGWKIVGYLQVDQVRSSLGVESCQLDLPEVRAYIGYLVESEFLKCYN